MVKEKKASKKKKAEMEVVEERGVTEISDSFLPGDGDDFVPDIQPINLQEIDDEMSKLTSDEVKAQIIECRENIENNYWQLCKCLFHVEKKRLYESWGYKTFNAFVEKELTYQKSKARYLVQIWKCLYIDQPDKTILERVLKVGWSKAKELIYVINSDNAENWIEKANHLSVEELKKEVKEYLAKLAPPKDNEKEVLANVDNVEGTTAEEMTRPMNFVFNYQDFVTVTQAVDRVKSELGGSSVSTSQAIALICADYLATNVVNETAGSAELNMDFVVDSIRKYEAMGGVQVVILDNEKEEVLYGEKHLEKLFADK